MNTRVLLTDGSVSARPARHELRAIDIRAWVVIDGDVARLRDGHRRRHVGVLSARLGAL